MQSSESKPISQWSKSKRWQRRAVRTVIGIFISLLLIAILAPDPDTIPKTAEQITADSLKHIEDSINSRKELLVKNNVFRLWDGSSPSLVKLTKESMNDPNSFEHIQTSYFDLGTDSITIIMDYTGENAFGGRVRGKVRALVSTKDGSVIRIISAE